MSQLELTSLSSRGQVVVPNSVRRALHLEIGSKFIVIQDGENILLKPIKAPGRKEFKAVLKLGEKVAHELGLTETSIKSAIKKVRNENSH